MLSSAAVVLGMQLAAHALPGIDQQSAVNMRLVNSALLQCT
jgi:hypothetical protein